MSPNPRDARAERETKEAKGIMVLVILAVMLFAVVDSLGWYQALQPFSGFSEMSQLLFTEFIVPFEVLGFLLLAALIGALYVAQKEVNKRV